MRLWNPKVFQAHFTDTPNGVGKNLIHEDMNALSASTANMAGVGVGGASYTPLSKCSAT